MDALVSNNWVSQKAHWTDERVNIVKDMWQRGVTATEIANILGKPFTRNSVIGKANRMDFKQPPKEKSPKAPRNRPRKRVLLPGGLGGFAINTRPRARVVVTAVHTLVNEDKPGIGIMELNDLKCHAIIGKGSNQLATYCGDPVKPGKSFCVGHCLKYFQPYQPRQRRR